MNIAIVIPARYGSTRFPGKPLAMIGGQSMLRRVVAVAQDDVLGGYDIDLMVATEDERIAAHTTEIGVECVMTPESCATGSDRVLAAVKASGRAYDFILNLQGDAPFTPPALLKGLIDLAKSRPDAPVVTPVHALSWAELDALREKKQRRRFRAQPRLYPKGGPCGFRKIYSRQSVEKIAASSHRRCISISGCMDIAPMRWSVFAPCPRAGMKFSKGWSNCG